MKTDPWALLREVVEELSNKRQVNDNEPWSILRAALEVLTKNNLYNDLSLMLRVEEVLVQHNKTSLLDAVTNVQKMALEDACPKCGNKTLERQTTLLSGSYGGAVTCLFEGCEHRETSYSYLGRTMFTAQPMPPPTDLIYLTETTPTPHEDKDDER